MKSVPALLPVLVLGAAVLTVSGAALSDVTVAGDTGPSTQTTPYVEPTASGVRTVSIFTVGDSVNAKLDGVTPYRLIGIPDGMGGFDNGDGTFTLLVNHEISSALGVARAHGSTGATVSAWVVERDTLRVLSGQDLVRTTLTWNATTQAWVQQTTAMSRLCSADLAEPSAYFDPASGKGTRFRIFLSGEESANGRAFGHLATGPNTGTSFELPRLGRDAWENLLACPLPQEKTLVACIDDTTPGQVYLYVGTKSATGTEIERAGLTNGKLYGIVGNAVRTEDRTTGIGIAKGASAPFTLVDLGNQAADGVVTQTVATNAGITEWLRPEDGAWDPRNPRDLYFVTTDRFDQTKNGTGAQVGRSRLWRLRFADLANPEQGGQVTLLLDGSEAHQMLDNVCMDRTGRLLLQEDPGNVSWTARIWQFDTGAGTLTEIARHDADRFGSESAAATAPFSQDEESSGIFDASELLGPGWFLLCSQAHGGTSPGTELVENGQLLALFNPASVVPPRFLAEAAVSEDTPDVGETVRFTAEAASPGNGAVTYAWTFGDGSSGAGSPAAHAYEEAGTYTATVVATHVPTGRTAQSVVEVTVGRPIPRPTVAVLLNFATSGRDTVTLLGELPVPEGFTLAGSTMSADVGGVSAQFTFDDKGRASAGSGSARITVRSAGGTVPSQRAPFSVTFRGDLANALADEGLTDATTTAIVYVPVTLTFGGRTVVHPVELTYTAKAGKKGSAR